MGKHGPNFMKFYEMKKYSKIHVLGEFQRFLTFLPILRPTPSTKTYLCKEASDQKKKKIGSRSLVPDITKKFSAQTDYSLYPFCPMVTDPQTRQNYKHFLRSEV